jgi:hypothetical protein
MSNTDDTLEEILLTYQNELAHYALHHDEDIAGRELQRKFDQAKAALIAWKDAAALEAEYKLLRIGTGNADGLASVNMGEVSDGYHTFNELYEFRMLYNAALFNEWRGREGVLGFEVHKSKRHSGGELCFGGGWFVVTALLPTGQITNHYEMKDWDLFKIPERAKAAVWDGHTPQDVAKRLREYLSPAQLQAREEKHDK